ncbi:MAG: polysaccharide biosynthesis tyrosine autokinase [Planctomycetota bacterium]
MGSTNGNGQGNGHSHGHLMERASEAYATEAVRLAPEPVRMGAEPSGGKLNLVGVLWGRKLVITLCLILGAAAAWAYGTQLIDEYRSISLVYIERQGPRVISYDDMAMSINQGLSAQVQIMRSSTLINQALELPAMQQTELVRTTPDAALAAIASGLIVKPSMSGDLLTVEYISPNSQDNAVIVNSIVEAYIGYHNSKKRKTASEVLKILRDEKAQLETEFEELNRAMLKFKQDRSTITFVDASVSPEIARLQRLSEEYTQAQLRTIQTRMDLGAARAVKDDPEQLEALIKQSKLAGNPIAASVSSDIELEVGIERTKRQLAAVTLRHGEQHHLTKSLAANLLVMQDELSGTQGSAADRYIETLLARYDDSVAIEATMKKEYEEQRIRAMQQDIQQTEYQMMEVVAKRLNRQIDIIDGRIKEINVTEDTGVLTISVLEPAVASATVVSPNRTRILAMGLLLGMMVGVGLAFLLDWLDDRVRSADELTDYLGLAVLGALPKVEKAAATKMGAIVEQEPRSAIAEGYRTVRTALHFGTLRTGGRTILVTSPQASDGKSTVVSNLATAFAQTGARTLIVDADCRKPMQHKLQGLRNKVGLTSVLNEDVTLEDAIQPTGVPSMDLLSCGPLPTNPAELLNTAMFEQLLIELTERYDRILIDSPPVVAVNDARVIAALADATLLLVKAGSSRRKVVDTAVLALESVGARIVGTVVNCVVSGRGRYGGYGPYGYYGHGQGYESAPTSSGLLEAGMTLDDDALRQPQSQEIKP